MDTNLPTGVWRTAAIILTGLVALTIMAGSAAAAPALVEHELASASAGLAREAMEATPTPTPKHPHHEDRFIFIPSGAPSTVSGELESSWGRLPDSAMGTLYTTTEIPGTGTYEYGQCSATSVASRSQEMILTAAHCMEHRNGHTVDFAQFMPGYEDGKAPYGAWTIASFAVMPQWEEALHAGGEPDFSHDVAFLKTEKGADEDGNGETLASVAGSLPLAFDPERAGSFEEYGYPGEYPYDGENLYRIEAPYVGDEDEYTTPTLGVATDFTDGSSGGAWVREGSVVGINSYTVGARHLDAHAMFSPYFGPEVQAMYEAYGGGGEGAPAGMHHVNVVIKRAGARRGHLDIGVPSPGTVAISGPSLIGYEATTEKSAIVGFTVALRKGSAGLRRLCEDGRLTVPVTISWRPGGDGRVLKFQTTVVLRHPLHGHVGDGSSQVAYAQAR